MKQRFSRLFTFGFLLCSISLTSCGNADEMKRLIEENSRLKQQQQDLVNEDGQLRSEYAVAIEQLNAIEDTLRAIAEREKEIQSLTQHKEFSGNLSQRQGIMARLEALKEANEQSKEQAKALQGQVKSLKIQNDNLLKMIASTEAKVLEKEAQIQEQNNIIAEMRSTLNQMQGDLLATRGQLSDAYKDLQERNAQLESTIANLTAVNNELSKKNTFIDQTGNCYIVCGTKRELRKKNIMQDLGSGLANKYKDNVMKHGSKVTIFGTDEFTCSAEGGNIASILPKRDESSYEIQGARLIIKNPDKFWALDRVVVLVKEKE